MAAGWRSIGLLCLATTLWGASSAVLALIGAGVGATAPVAAGGAVVLIGLAAVCGDRPWRVFAADRRFYLLLGVLEAANLGLYLAALRLGPLPVVVALHLTAPVLIILARIVRGRLPITLSVFLELALVGAGIVLVGAARTGGSAPSAALIGCLLAVGSAACVAGLIVLVAANSAAQPTVSAAGSQLGVAAVFAAPLAVAAPPPNTAVLALLATGALLLGPGFACYWWALRTADATTAGIIGLNEAVVASLLGAVLAGTRLTPAALAGGALVLGAVAVQNRFAPAIDGGWERISRSLRTGKRRPPPS
ncbi:DMT family transporter [Nocardia sp. NPDC005978]|uniref:DMT family transporter n=1 Tax=Nocardia sp. NPDC005978 TaxID=3156725 RepID=UPI0033B91F5C